jgi:hypothetical protein
MLHAGAQIQVKGVVENDLRAEFFQFALRQGLNVASVPTGMKTGVSMCRAVSENSGARAAFSCCDFKFHQYKDTECDAPLWMNRLTSTRLLFGDVARGSIPAYTSTRKHGTRLRPWPSIIMRLNNYTPAKPVSCACPSNHPGPACCAVLFWWSASSCW